MNLSSETNSHDSKNNGSVTGNKSILPFHIPQALSVQKDQDMVWFGGVRHTPHQDALGFRLHCGAQRETCKGREESSIQ